MLGEEVTGEAALVLSNGDDPSVFNTGVTPERSAVALEELEVGADVL
jgi:hypothetical protein